VYTTMFNPEESNLQHVKSNGPCHADLLLGWLGVLNQAFSLSFELSQSQSTTQRMWTKAAELSYFKTSTLERSGLRNVVPISELKVFTVG
jgi:hypothetical protein